MSKTVLFQTTQFSIYKQFYIKQFILAQVRSLHFKTFLFQATQFSISTQFSSIWPIDRTLIRCQSRPGSDGNEVVLRIPQNFSITGTLLSDCFVSYQDTRLVGWGYPSAEMQLVYPADWAKTII